jgi:protein-L-isoaspartate(D-aspartate) O-methyltransferase
MVEFQLAARGIADPRVLDAMRRVPRHEYVPADVAAFAYGDSPLPIGHGVTISQPYIVALMSEALRVIPTDHVLEIGTGSGYGAAVLAELGADVVTVETIEPLATQARARLAPYGDRVFVVTGDGTLGYPDRAPYDAISVTAAAPEVPSPLLDQLAPGGRLCMPVGSGIEDLVVVTRRDSGFERAVITQVRFVPLIGRYGIRYPGHDT